MKTDAELIRALIRLQGDVKERVRKGGAGRELLGQALSRLQQAETAIARAEQVESED